MKIFLSFFLSFFLFEQKINCENYFKNGLYKILDFSKKNKKTTLSISALALLGIGYVGYNKYFFNKDELDYKNKDKNKQKSEKNDLNAKNLNDNQQKDQQKEKIIYEKLKVPNIKVYQLLDVNKNEYFKQFITKGKLKLIKYLNDNQNNEYLNNKSYQNIVEVEKDEINKKTFKFFIYEDVDPIGYISINNKDQIVGTFQIQDFILFDLKDKYWEKPNAAENNSILFINILKKIFFNNLVVNNLRITHRSELFKKGYFSSNINFQFYSFLNDKLNENFLKKYKNSREWIFPRNIIDKLFNFSNNDLEKEFKVFVN